INSPGRGVSGELVGHIGIIKREADELFLIHASGKKHKGGEVKKLRFMDYIGTMPFIGIRVSRFETERARHQ
ncbi:MAG: DUF1460 domain-containing protein, partial [Nitrospirae bacterium]|nr:DUF1460 domain-containing protein [Nitrospirota bacterium]